MLFEFNGRGRAALLAVLLLESVLSSCRPEPVEIALIMTSDLQSRIVPSEQVIDGAPMTVGGLERIAAAAAEVRGEVDGALLISTGDDMIAPLYWMFGGEPEMRGMTAAGYDVLAPGNHEFDLGAAGYDAALAFAGCDVVSANVHAVDPALLTRIQPHVIKEAAGVRIGLFGMMTPDLHRISLANEADVTVDGDIVRVAREQVQALEAAGCDLVVAVSHMGIELDRVMADNVPGIDVIIGGQDHTFLYEERNGAIVAEDLGSGVALGVLRFTFDNGRIVAPSWETRLLADRRAVDRNVHGLLAPFVAQYEERLSAQIGVTDAPLDARYETLRGSESNLGNLVTDAWTAWFSDVDIALLNGGSMRGNRLYPAGPVSYETVQEILAFRNTIYRAQLTGAQLRHVLEISASAIRVAGDGCPDANRAPSGGFMQMAGVRVQYDLSGPCFCAQYDGDHAVEVIEPGGRVAGVEVFQAGAWMPLDPEAHYTVLVNAWIASGGDGYYVFTEPSVTLEDTTVVSTDVAASYIETHSPVNPSVEGRITFVAP